MADIFSGYVIYAPATFVIKGLMAFVACIGFKLLSKFMNNRLSRTISGAAAEVLMVVGYFIFEGFMYGFLPSAVNIPANSVQGAAGLILGSVLIRIFAKNKISVD